MAVSCAKWIFSAHCPQDFGMCIMISCDWDRLQEMWNDKFWGLRINSRKLSVILVTALFSLTCTPEHCPDGRTWWSYNYCGDCHLTCVPVEQRLGFCKKIQSPKSKEFLTGPPLQQCILMGVVEGAGQRGFSVFQCPVLFLGTERILFSYIGEGSWCTRSHLKASLNWKWKKQVTLPVFIITKVSI